MTGYASHPPLRAAASFDHALHQPGLRLALCSAYLALVVCALATLASPAQQAYIKASNTKPNAFFGSVAVSGDTAVVGDPKENSNATGVNGNQSDNSAPGSGAVYVFVRSGTNWTQ